MKLVINRCFGGYGLSKQASKMLAERKKIEYDDYGYYFDVERSDRDLVAIVEELGSEKASGDCAKLCIVEIPDNIEFEIDDYDGVETVHEVHRSWS